MASFGVISNIFSTLHSELESKNSASVSDCMTVTLLKFNEMPEKTARLLKKLGKTLGQFDLNGQVHMLISLRQEADGMLKTCEEGHRIRSRSCKTIALCIGAAIVVLLL